MRDDARGEQETPVARVYRCNSSPEWTRASAVGNMLGSRRRGQMAAALQAPPLRDSNGLKSPAEATATHPRTNRSTGPSEGTTVARISSTAAFALDAKWHPLRSLPLDAASGRGPTGLSQSSAATRHSRERPRPIQCVVSRLCHQLGASFSEQAGTGA
jgi:hypothetical protein